MQKGRDKNEMQKMRRVFFDEKKSRVVVEDLKRKELLKELPALSIRQKIIKLSKNRLGFYFNKDLARSAKLKAGEPIEVSLLNKKIILVEVK